MAYFQVAQNEIVQASHMNIAVNQGVIPFPTAAARDAAIPTPAEGQSCYLTGSGTDQVYRSGQWWGDESWTAATMRNGWVNSGGEWAPASFRRTADKQVFIRGLIMSGTNNSEVFTLPAGYRPPASLILAVVGWFSGTPGAAAVGGRLGVDANGIVKLGDWQSGISTGWVSLSCSFFAG